MEQGLTSYTLFLAIFPSDANVLVIMEFVVVDCRREVYEGQTRLGMNFLVGQYYASKGQRAMRCLEQKNLGFMQ